MYQIISEDITLFGGDAILNSLGRGKERIVAAPGGVFQSILNRVNDPDALMEAVFVKGAELPVSKAFQTGSFGLSCKSIIHAVSPFRFEDTDDLTVLKKTYENALHLAYKAGVRSICLPLIGTGANGYKSSESFRAAKEVAYAFGEKYKDFSVFVTVFWGHGDLRPTVLVKKRVNFRSEACCFSLRTYGDNMEDAFHERLPLDRTHRERGPVPQLGVPIKSSLINMDLLDLRVGDSFGRLIDLFLIAREGDDSEEVLQDGWREIAESITGARRDFDEDDNEDHIFQGANFKSIWHKHPNYRKKDKGSKTKSEPKKHKRGEEDPDGIWSVPGKLQILLTACALGMTKKQTEFMFKFCGYYLSKFNVEDLAIKACYRCLASETEEAAILDVYQIYYEHTGKMPFVKRKDPWRDS